jgi:TonB family protein
MESMISHCRSIVAEGRYRARRDRDRSLRAARARRNLAHAWPGGALLPDVKSTGERSRGFTTLCLLAAIGGHGVLGYLALSLPPHAAPEAAPIRVRVVRPPAAQVEPEPSAPAQPAAPPDRAAPEPAPKPAPKRTPPRRSTQQPPPSASDAPPPIIVGLTLESTSRGASGPSFAVGSSLLGATARRAAAPRPQPPAPAPVPSRNRVARARPAEGVRVTPARRLSRVEPTYPPLLQRQRIEGDVGVRVSLAADGSVRDVEIVRAAQDQAFNDAALEAAKSERFSPETHDGQPVPTSITYTYRFRISP